MFENFKRMATPRNITILMAIIGVFILIMVLKYFNLYEGLTGADADKAAADKAAADKAAADNVSLTPIVGPATNGPLIK